jgi:hypothetical protein
MVREQRELTAMRLEGLVLRDGQGALYEVPCLLIERYRVTDERAAELAGQSRAASMPAPEGGVLGAAAWSVQGGVYVAAGATGDGATSGRPGYITDTVYSPT